MYCISVTFLTFVANMLRCSYAANLFTVNRVNPFTLRRCSYTVNLFIAINTWRFPHLTLGKTYPFCCTNFRRTRCPCMQSWLANIASRDKCSEFSSRRLYAIFTAKNSPKRLLPAEPYHSGTAFG